ncbi:hypothetical protein BDZ89DRAFT_511823 [Hymenopellis radicata]|nr:hypothetical protein BDZ89DRAFT_511823 [Hymenopellis radicata]
MTRRSRREVMVGYIDGSDTESFAALNNHNEKPDSLSLASSTVGNSGRWVPQVPPSQTCVSPTKTKWTASLTSSSIVAELRTPPPSYVFFVANATTDLGSPLFDPPPESRQSHLAISPARNTTSTHVPSSPSYEIRHSAHSHDLPRLMTVTAVFAPTHDDELPIATGDVVRQLSEFADGWCLVQEVGGKNARKGVVPRLCLSEHQGITSIPEKAAISQHSRGWN